MPGEPLMCVWQTIYDTEVLHKNGVQKTSLQSLLQKQLRIKGFIHYSEEEFEKTFTESEVDFEMFVTYAKESLCSTSLPLPLIIEKIEAKCWDICASIYKSRLIGPNEIGKLWRVFCRLCDEGTYPPTMSDEQSKFLFKEMEKYCAIGGLLRKEQSNSGEKMDFKQLIRELEGIYICTETPDTVRHCVEQINKWLVKEVSKTGLLYQRIRKNSHWTGWKKFWFQLTAAKLTYYENDQVQGSIVFDKHTTLEKIEDGIIFLVKKNRFKMCTHSEIIELSAKSVAEKEEWCSSIQANINALKRGKSARMLLFQRSPISSSEKSLSKTKQLSVQEDEIQENNIAEIKIEKIRVLFLRIDKDGNGRIDHDEFVQFLCNLGAKVTQSEASVIFHAIDKNKDSTVSFEEFVNYLLKFVLLKSKESETECNLRKSFLEADRDMSGAVNFREFSDYVYTKNKAIALDKLLAAFDKLDANNQGQLYFDDFKEFLKSEPIFQQVDTIENSSTYIEDLIKKTYEDIDVESFAELVTSRWEKFVDFKRYGANTDIVMSGCPKIVSDIVPGNYSLLDLACFNDLPPIEPKLVKISGISWNSSALCGRSGHVLFPGDFDGIIPTEIATDETLAFYGASLATGNKAKVSLLYRHCVQDFTYENNYLDQYVTAENALGGAGLEKHQFAHLDCPFEDDSGYFILGKLENDVLHLTAFKVPTRHTIYVPQGVIHSNDYLKGTWRTMLSDEANIDHVQLVKMQRKGNKEELEHFTFSFTALV